MAIKKISIGSNHNKYVYDDTAGDISLDTDGPIRTTSTPSVPTDVLRLVDFLSGGLTEIVIGDGADPFWRIRVELPSFDWVRERFIASTWTEQERVNWTTGLQEWAGDILTTGEGSFGSLILPLENTPGFVKNDATGLLLLGQGIDISTDVSGILPVGNGGTGLATYSIGDLLYASGSAVFTKLVSVSAGSYLRSGGVTTAPLWSTLKLPNAATVNQVIRALSTDNWGSDASNVFDGSIFEVINAQDAATAFRVTNTNNGTNARAQLILTNNTGSCIALNLLPASHATFPDDLLIATGNANANIVIRPNNSTTFVSLASGPVIIGSSLTPTSPIASAGDLQIDNDLLIKRKGLTTVGSTSVRAGLGGTMHFNLTSVGNVTTGEDDLMSYTLGANSLVNNGDSIYICAYGTVANSANLKRIKLYFGSVVFDSSFLAISTAGDWLIEAWITRESSTTSKSIAKAVFGGGLANATSDMALPTATFSSTVTIKVTGEAVATLDIVQEGMLVQYWPVGA